jgi:hypothetical protein
MTQAFYENFKRLNNFSAGQEEPNKGITANEDQLVDGQINYRPVRKTIRGQARLPSKTAPESLQDADCWSASTVGSHGERIGEEYGGVPDERRFDATQSKGK